MSTDVTCIHKCSRRPVMTRWACDLSSILPLNFHPARTRVAGLVTSIGSVTCPLRFSSTWGAGLQCTQLRALPVRAGRLIARRRNGFPFPSSPGLTGRSKRHLLREKDACTSLRLGSPGQAGRRRMGRRLVIKVRRTPPQPAPPYTIKCTVNVITP
jgi:hypothetical protein